jgi:SAM-dependent methyltransferase
VPAVQQVDLSGSVDGHVERFVPEAMHGELVEAEHLGRYWWVSRLAAGRRVLDAGCGVAYGSQILLEADASSVTGVDLSPEVIAAAGTRVSSRIDLRQADLGSLPFPDDSFDLAVCFEVIEHVLRPHPILSELARVLAPGGVLAISTPNRDASMRDNPHHVNEMTPDELREALDRHFGHVRLVRQHTWLTSAIFEDPVFAGAGPEPLDVDVRKVWAAVPGEEAYTLALAGDGPAPMAGAVAVLCNALGFHKLVEHMKELERLLQGRPAPGPMGELALRLQEADRVLERLVALEARPGGGGAAGAGLESELAETRAKLQSVISSRSWRMLAPARAVAGRLRAAARRA